MARVIITKLSPKSLEQEIREFVIPLADRQLFHLSKATEQAIQEQIRNSIKRSGSTGKLASSFFAEKIAEGYGVGNISFLNTEAPYWYWQNYGVAQSGRRVPPETIGKFDGFPAYPVPNQNNQRWSSDGYYYMRPVKPIEAMNYIEKIVARIPDLANQTLNTVK